MRRLWLIAVIAVSCIAPAAVTSTTSTSTTSTSSTSSTTTTSVARPTTSTPAAVEATGLTCWSAPGGGGVEQVTLADVTRETGLIEPLTGMHGHAAIWTDVNGDEFPDLYVGTYADRPVDDYRKRGAGGPSPDRLLLGGETGFTLDDDLAEVRSRSSGGASADLDGDGDLDLVVSRNMTDSSDGMRPTEIYENDAGTFRAVEHAGIPDNLAGRSVALLDHDGDGLLDLFVVEDRYAGGSSVLLRNLGDLRFDDVTDRAGLPDEVGGLGVVAADLDGDGSQDLFVAGSNRLFLSNGPGRFTEADNDVFGWEPLGEEDDVAGVSAADINRDGLADLAIGQHFNSTVESDQRVAVRLYLNLGEGRFRDVTEQAGLAPLPTKAPHVELNDLNNDGWPDLLTSAVSGEGPAVFLHEGLDDGVPNFSDPGGLGSDQYWVSAPTADYDRDGRLDVFLLEWEPALPSILLRNETSGGNWLEVSVGSEHGHGVGWRVELFAESQLIGAREITVTQGYASGVLPVAHFGLGDRDQVTVRLVPPGGEAIELAGTMANQHIRWPAGCG